MSLQNSNIYWGLRTDFYFIFLKSVYLHCITAWADCIVEIFHIFVTLIFQLDNKKDAFSSQLQEFCLSHPIAVIRGLTSVLKLGE